jgi:hypothetical protein
MILSVTAVITVLKKVVIGALATVGMLLIIWAIFGARMQYLVQGCSQGVRPCTIAILIVLGIVDVEDQRGNCIGAGCNM